MTCSFCQTPGTVFTAITHEGERKQICKPCIKLGKATPEKPRPHVAIPCSSDIKPQHDLDNRQGRKHGW